MESKIAEMFSMQYALNKKTAGKDWMHRFDVVFENAIIAETAELLESLGYKWWKAREVDAENAKVEVVDLWHFVMSFVMQQSQGHFTFEEHAAPFVDAFATTKAPSKKSTLECVCYQFVGNVCNYDGNHLRLAKSFVELVLGVGLTFDKLYEMYIIKNALNKLRQNRGYADGTYRKDWNGVEDNVVAMKIVKCLTFDECYAKLEKYYDTHIV